MPRSLVLTSGADDPTLAGRSLSAHWSAVVADAALPAVTPSARSGTLIVIDGRYAALPAARLRALAATLGEAPGLGGALVTPEGALVAVALRSADPERGAELLAHPGGHTIHLSAGESWSVADEWGRAQAEAAVVQRVCRRLAAVGVRLIDPQRIWVEPSVRVAPGATLWGGAVLLGRTRVGAGATIHAGAWLRDTEVGPGTVVKPYTVCDGASIGSDCAVGPSAHLRPGAALRRDVKVGNFVEIKKAVLHEGVRASHLSYLGDAEIGAGANVGAGTITCNYDGFGKHRTEIGAGAFIGSNTALVAPVCVGAGAIVGAGSTITRSVPTDALVVERAEERVFEGRAPRLNARNQRRAEARRDG